MAYRNKCSFIGNIGRDIEVKNFPSGGKVGNTSLAVTRKWKDAQGVKQEKTIWIPLNVPEYLLENATKYVTKGKNVLVDGELDVREYTSQGGEKHTAFSLRVTDYQLLGAPKPDGTTDTDEQPDPGPGDSEYQG